MWDKIKNTVSKLQGKKEETGCEEWAICENLEEAKQSFEQEPSEGED